MEYSLGFVLWKLTQYSAVQSLYQKACGEHVEMKPGLLASLIQTFVNKMEEAFSSLNIEEVSVDWVQWEKNTTPQKQFSNDFDILYSRENNQWVGTNGTSQAVVPEGLGGRVSGALRRND